ncbi:hypothetical protein CHLRE_12g517681v5 [Chlamydomonas reinhardtii]|uniref:Transposase n=1 Tax=Chlamydomonas reinhardtii TaxID=3055 RepID=A0A2K3D3V7_CHLRE|nr:uncharacterized protein CHLRE_12g517681v5 [Chlamydomonas reinhardtii]PNW75216.1 hypothetical protein CHLRE_12g517681v5 [Chlamydomonas reinhardtii]
MCLRLVERRRAVAGALRCVRSSGAAACAAIKELPQGGAGFDVRVCNDCHTTWDRDENAARNVRLLLILQLLGRDRPAVFCRQEGGAGAAG